jgi:transcriptional regulator with XRE-family HTH domain
MKSVHSRRYQRLLDRLKAARRTAGLTQVDVARALGKPQSFVSKCESGERRIDVVELEVLARLYGISLVSLFEEASTVREKVVGRVKGIRK